MLAAPVVVDVHTTITVQVQSADTEITTLLPPVVETDLTPRQCQQLPLVVSGLGERLAAVVEVADHL